MTRIILILSIGIFVSLQTAFSQLQLTFADATGDVNTQVSVDVTSDNFPDLVLFQYSVNWDSTVMRINSITNVNSTLPNYNAGSNFGLPATSVDVIPGQLTTTWDHPQFLPTNLPSGTLLFTMVFDLVGNAGDQTSITVSDEPKDREAVIGDFSTDVGVQSNTGTVTINGGGGNNTDLKLIVSEEIAGPGSVACVEVSVENFEDIESAQFSMSWNTSIINYNTIQGFAPLMGLDINAFNTANVATGSLIFFWSEPNGNMVTLNDGDILFEVCYDVVGTLGQMSTVDIVNAPVAIEVFGNGVTYDPTTNNLTIDNGKVTIENPPADPPIFTVGQNTGSAGSESCVPISIENFNDIVSFGYSITYDPAELEFSVINNLNLPGLSVGSFNLVNAGQLNVSWNSISSGNETFDDRVIFEVCFNVLAPCEGETHPVRIGKAGSTPEVATIDMGQPIAISGVVYNDGSINCGVQPPTCEASAVPADCGDGLGDLFATIMNADNACECAWTGPATMSSTVGAGCNFLGVPAGTYTLTITCNGVVECTSMATVDAAPTIDIAGNVTDAGCDGLGAITSIPTGGTMPYIYLWSNNENTPAITNLQPNDYTVTITDAAGCSNMRTFNVSGDVTPINISMFDQSDVLCFGDNTGSASITAADGCTPYTYAWTGSSSTDASANDLSAGSASVTVTDKNGVTASMSFTIAEPTPISISASSITPSCPDAMEGSIMLSVTGGTNPYSQAWSDGGDGSNLNPGSYDVTITDGNNCTASGTFVVTESEPAVCDGECPSLAISVSDFNGFGVSCNGDANGSADISVSGGTYPITFSLSGPISSSQEVAAAGSFGFDDLPAGDYTVSNPSCPDFTFSITEPSVFSIASVNVGDASENSCDGFIDYTHSGGVGDITCMINGVLETDCDFSDLCAGTYVISFEDANGCSVDRMVNVPGEGGPEPTDCYKVTSVITPNMDGINDRFDISCVNDFPARLQVFDRWGRLVYNNEVYDGQWGGTDSNENILPEAAYMYVLIVDFGSGRQEVFKGTLTILRSI